MGLRILLIGVLVSSVKTQTTGVPAKILDLAAQINDVSNHTKNSVFSPLIISTALNLLLLGADGESKQQLNKFLRSTPDEPEIKMHKEYNSILDMVNKSNSVAVKIASAVAIQKTLDLNKEYVDGMREYKAQKALLDFTDQETAKKSINAWVAGKTNNKITELVKDPLPSSTKLVILTAIYFRGGWRTPFNKDLTRKEDFFVSPGNAIPADFMEDSMTVKYADSSSLGCKAIVLPYQGEEYEMLLLLPKSDKPEAVAELEAKLNAQAIDKLGSEMDFADDAYIRIPKFKIRNTFSVLPVLEKAGINSVFGPTANLTRFTTEPVRVDEILHQAFIEVNEEGTEAAAATAVLPIRAIPKSFIANRPFIFSIRHAKLNLPLFTGRIVKPEYEE